MMFRFSRSLAIITLAAAALVSSGCRRHKYENPIGKDTKQPDKVLFDRAVADIERGRYEVARITLQTLMNTYDTSEFLAKSKLAIADSWFREGGSHGLAQAEAEYKDFILFYPTMEESAEAQEKVCKIHYKQMEKADRDDKHAFKAEEECRNLLTLFPNSKFAPSAQQLLRNIQEVLGEKEMRVSEFYHDKGSHPAASNRFQALSDQFPLFSRVDQALWLLGDSYSKMGPRFKQKSTETYSRIVKDYPLSPYSDLAKKKLTAAEATIPDPDPVALARMKYERENATKTGMMHNFFRPFAKSPETAFAAKSGAPTMTPMKPTIPVSVPVPAAVTGTSEVGGEVLGGNKTALDTQPDARANTPAAGTAVTPDAAKPAEGATATTPVATPGATNLPSNYDGKNTKKPKKEKTPKKVKLPAGVKVKTDATKPEPVSKETTPKQ